MSTLTTSIEGHSDSAAPRAAPGRPTLSLRMKTFLTVAGTLIAVMVILWFSLSWIFVARFNKIEMHDAANDVTDASALLAAYFVPLRITAGDWSAWDESFRFVQDGNAAYRENNLSAFDLTNLQVDVMAYVQPNGHITFGTGVNRDSGTLYPLPSGLKALLTPNDLLVQQPSADKSVSGFLSLPKGILMVVADPITYNIGSRPSRGALIVGRYLTQADLAAVQNNHHLKSLALEPLSSPNMPDTMKSAAAQLNAGSKTVVHPVNSGLTLASTLVPNLYGKPTFILQAGADRSTYQEARQALHYLMYALIAVGVVFLGVLLLLLERLVLRRLATVNQGVKAIGARRDPTMRLDSEGSDEIGQLAWAINQMLQALENAQVREHHLNAQIAELHIQIDEARRDREVEKITDSDYFRGLTERAEHLRKRNAPTAT